MKNTKVRVNYLMSANLIRTLWEGPGTTQELADQCGATYQTALFYLNALRSVNLVRRNGRAPDKRGCMSLVVWEWAPDKKDVPYKALGNSERQKRYRQRKKADEVFGRLTTLGHGAGEHTQGQGSGPAPAVDSGLHHGGEQMV